MGAQRFLAVVLTVFATAPCWAAEPQALIKARSLYNAADYDAAIAAADMARTEPGAADASALVAARARLERYRSAFDAADLMAAREALGGIRASALSQRDQVDLLIGLGQSLYFDDIFGAAAEIFDAALGRGALLTARDRLKLLDWWATALDRDALAGPLDRRRRIYERIAARMEEEVRQDPANAPANYWLAAAARGTGDLDLAWSTAVAAWVRASLEPETTMSLRADLDRLVSQALIPDRVHLRPPREQPDATIQLQAEWESIKAQWH